MNARRQAKKLLKDAFPWIWLHWHLMHRPKSAERELSYLGKVVPEMPSPSMSAPIAACTRASWRGFPGRCMPSSRRSRWRGCCGGRRPPMSASTKSRCRIMTGKRNCSSRRATTDWSTALPRWSPGSIGGGACDLESRADRAARCRRPPGRGLREDRRRRTRTQRAQWCGRTCRAQPAGISGRSGGPSPRRGDAIGVRVLPRRVLSRLLPRRATMSSRSKNSAPTAAGRRKRWSRMAAARPGSATSTISSSSRRTWTASRY